MNNQVKVTFKENNQTFLFYFKKLDAYPNTWDVIAVSDSDKKIFAYVSTINVESKTIEDCFHPAATGFYLINQEGVEPLTEIPNGFSIYLIDGLFPIIRPTIEVDD